MTRSSSCVLKSIAKDASAYAFYVKHDRPFYFLKHANEMYHVWWADFRKIHRSNCFSPQFYHFNELILSRKDDVSNNIFASKYDWTFNEIRILEVKKQNLRHKSVDGNYFCYIFLFYCAKQTRQSIGNNLELNFILFEMKMIKFKYYIIFSFLITRVNKNIYQNTCV